VAHLENLLSPVREVVAEHPTLAAHREAAVPGSLHLFSVSDKASGSKRD